MISVAESYNVLQKLMFISYMLQLFWLWLQKAYFLLCKTQLYGILTSDSNHSFQ